jgi:hypothetical protein
MTSSDSDHDDFTGWRERYDHRYQDLLTLAAAYPAELRDREGACGWWSARHVLQHLSGWIWEGDRRYSEYDAGLQQRVRYDDDAFNAQSVEERKTLDWEASLAELRQAVQVMSEHAHRVTDAQAEADERYRDWMIGLSNDAELHAQQLRDFLKQG